MVRSGLLIYFLPEGALVDTLMDTANVLYIIGYGLEVAAVIVGAVAAYQYLKNKV